MPKEEPTLETFAHRHRRREHSTPRGALNGPWSTLSHASVPGFTTARSSVTGLNVGRGGARRSVMPPPGRSLQNEAQPLGPTRDVARIRCCASRSRRPLLDQPPRAQARHARRSRRALVDPILRVSDRRAPPVRATPAPAELARDVRRYEQGLLPLARALPKRSAVPTGASGESSARPLTVPGCPGELSRSSACHALIAGACARHCSKRAVSRGAGARAPPPQRAPLSPRIARRSRPQVHTGRLSTTRRTDAPNAPAAKRRGLERRLGPGVALEFAPVSRSVFARGGPDARAFTVADTSFRAPPAKIAGAARPGFSLNGAAGVVSPRALLLASATGH